ncbi:mandelate racemase/muconate lactonizing enzyme family protein [Bradyrhizobium sp. U87765 SZCCT0131]|uniref:mandelate racemase/muconate lactonizing enzyme family protein n=1 Tax=unclassified Bradyrhizobium TaxID=2631580 RepID=UPI001BAC049A|nr:MULTISPECIES: mandelate racemase/muconate lactonizing enzyme family protein [unclassified Bradyrhizobium]MBR1219407.1 mandelate racemase/muconate lactonizing enzyme family protein [Bradyrhizobium sp. U87765 SZCCT0131]MBR1262058.1 mandelate racemase/muconate lactonizing enzyme family protein [Bradyrhizobium sp. U87765 SZCCT0134]MBR1306089.1 mandelate racemase/muconate lactonizing enzyme family protein [Bradyrhizobium sp. U87765 SZCCT0110]MBR1317840.1 mandelate racemase/muconate lactonizing en
MSRIASVEARTVRVPLERATAFARRQVTQREYALVRIRTTDGVEGIGHCYGGHAAAALVSDAVRQLLRPLLLGQDSHDTEILWQEMYQEALLHGRTGAVMRAISIVDTALWDCNARAARLPLYKYLGASARGTVPAYASGGYYLAGKTPEKLGEELAGYVALGFDAVKMKVGRLSPKEEEARIAAARKAIGPDVLLMLDANNAWSDVPTALRYMERYQDYDPYWIEEPFSPDQIDTHADLAGRIRVPVATGEIEAGRWRFKELLEKKAALILQTDALVCGGISEFRKIAALADGYGATMCPHWFHDVHVHLVASSPNARYVEFFADDQVLNFRRLIDRQLEISGNGLKLPQGEGLGYRFDEAAIARCDADAWS